MFVLGAKRQNVIENSKGHIPAKTRHLHFCQIADTYNLTDNTQCQIQPASLDFQ